MLTGLTQAFVSDLRHGPNKGGPKPKTRLFLESQTAGFRRSLYIKVELHRVGAGMRGGSQGAQLLQIAESFISALHAIS